MGDVSAFHSRGRSESRSDERYLLLYTPKFSNTLKSAEKPNIFALHRFNSMRSQMTSNHFRRRFISSEFVLEIIYWNNMEIAYISSIRAELTDW